MDRSLVELVITACAAKCDPAFPEVDALKKVDQAFRYDSSRACTEPTAYTAAGLMKTEFPEIKWVIPNILPEGLTILGGNPKTRKSFLALNHGVAVASGGKALGQIDVIQGSVLFLALEDGPRRLKKRLSLCLPLGGWPEKLHFFVDWPRVDKGGLEKIDQWLSEHEDTRLVVIDTLARLWPERKGKAGDGLTLYHLDYGFISSIKAVADKYSVAILGIHHLRKGKADIADPIELLSGSMGLAGSADSIHILARKRGQDEASLLVTGRDIETESELAIKFDNMIATWVLMGTSEEVTLSRERQAILDAFEDPDMELGPAQIAKSTDMKEANVRKLLKKLIDEGRLERVGYGRYKKPTTCSEERESFTGHTVHTGHTTHGGHTDHTPVKSSKILLFPASPLGCDKIEMPVTLNESSKPLIEKDEQASVTGVPAVSDESISLDEVMTKMRTAIGSPAPTTPPQKPVIRRTPVPRVVNSRQ